MCAVLRVCVHDAVACMHVCASVSVVLCDVLCHGAVCERGCMGCAAYACLCVVLRQRECVGQRHGSCVYVYVCVCVCVSVCVCVYVAACLS